MRIVYNHWLQFEGPLAWSVEEEGFVKMYTASLKKVAETSKLRELEVSIVIDIVTIDVMPDVERRIWRDLDAALTAKNLNKTLETLVLKVYVMPRDLRRMRCGPCGEVTEQYMADFEDWILAECLPATRRTYFDKDERGVLFCNNTREMSKGASSDSELSRLVALCSPSVVSDLLDFLQGLLRLLEKSLRHQIPDDFEAKGVKSMSCVA